jgi:hypothetical protein
MERLRGFARSQAVAVRLNRSSRRHSRTILQPAPIFLDGGAIDRQAQRAVHRPPFTVRPELVEGLLFFCESERRPFDRLRANG